MTVSPIPKGYHSVQPYLVVDNAKAVVEFCERAFDAVVCDRHDTPDGGIAHADVLIGDSHVMIGQASGDWPALPTNLYVYVEDCDRVYATALEAGAESVMPPSDMFYGDRHGGVRDAQGNVWWIATHIEDVPPEELARRAAEQKPGS